MALFSNLKKALGFSTQDIEDELSDDFPSALVTPINKRKDSTVSLQVHESQSESEHTTESAASEVTPQIMPDEIFDSVVKFINTSLPPYLRDNLDTQQQRRQLYDTLSVSMKEHIERLEQQASQRVSRQFASEQSNLKREMEAMRSKSKQIEEQANELKTLKLSAERQKRALTDRVHELESAVASFDAEREQYELENRSLVNKLRTLSVQEDDIKALRDENERLSAQIKTLKSTKASDETIVTGDGNANSQVEELLNDKKQLLDDIALLKKKCEIADSMINDLNHRATSAQNKVTEKENEINRLKEELENVRELAQSIDPDETQHLKDTIDDYAARLKQTAEELARTSEELIEAKEATSLFEQTLTKFEAIKAEKNRLIADLNSQLEHIKRENEQLKSQPTEDSTECNKLREEIVDLKATIANNLKMQAESEAALRNEIEQARKESSRAKRQRSKPAKDEMPLDDSLDNTDWLISSPPAGECNRLTAVNDNEFGYQEPKRRDNNPSDNSQMLLW